MYWYPSIWMRRTNRAAAPPTTPTKSTGTCTVLLGEDPGVDMPIEMHPFSTPTTPTTPSPSPSPTPIPFPLHFSSSAATSAVHTPKRKRSYTTSSNTATSPELGRSSSRSCAITNRNYSHAPPSILKNRCCAAGTGTGTGSHTTQRTPLGELSIAEVNARSRSHSRSHAYTCARARAHYARELARRSPSSSSSDENLSFFLNSSISISTDGAPGLEREVYEGLGEGTLFQPAQSAAAAANRIGYKGRRNYHHENELTTNY